MCKQKNVNTNSFHDMHNMTKNGLNIDFNKCSITEKFQRIDIVLRYFWETDLNKTIIFETITKLYVIYENNFSIIACIRHGTIINHQSFHELSISLDSFKIDSQSELIALNLLSRP